MHQRITFTLLSMALFFFLPISISTPFLSALPPSLDAAYKAAGKRYFGTCTDQGLLSRQQNAQLIQSVFGQVTPENSMKWQPLEFTRGQYRWAGADYLVEWAGNHSKIVRGHTLVWHSQLPGWVNEIGDRQQLANVIQVHVAAVMGRWKGRVYAWVGYNLSTVTIVERGVLIETGCCE
jgi:GH35 family endo-1,4-beta-xylanase